MTGRPESIGQMHTSSGLLKRRLRRFYSLHPRHDAEHNHEKTDYAHINYTHFDGAVSDVPTYFQFEGRRVNTGIFEKSPWP